MNLEATNFCSRLRNTRNIYEARVPPLSCHSANGSLVVFEKVTGLGN
jgi:hypothetical protein